MAGTGKTFGLRALAWEWREWCDFHYIVDPDTFFGQHADYLMSVLLQPEYMGMMVPSAYGFIASLNPDEASVWLAAQGAADGVGTSMTLAKLYARVAGRDPSETRLASFVDEGG
jgi:hypothetical protein